MSKLRGYFELMSTTGKWFSTLGGNISSLGHNRLGQNGQGMRVEKRIRRLEEAGKRKQIKQGWSYLRW